MMSTTTDEFEGLMDFSELISEYAKVAENVLDELEITAKEFVNDLLKLPKPKSNIVKGGYTHMIDTFTLRNNGKDIEVGWSKYYGRMVEDGTTKMSAQPHMIPLYESNKEQYMNNFMKRNNLI